MRIEPRDSADPVAAAPDRQRLGDRLAGGADEVGEIGLGDRHLAAGAAELAVEVEEPAGQAHRHRQEGALLELQR